MSGRRLMRGSRLVAIGAAGAALAGAAPAWADSWTNLVISGDVSATTNPFLQAGDPPTGVLGSIDLQPSYVNQTSVSQLTVRGDVRVDQYLSNYGTDVAAFAGVDYNRRLSERTSARLGAGFRTSSSLLRDQLLFRSNPGQLGLPTPLAPLTSTPAVDAAITPIAIEPSSLIFLPDPSLVGLRTRVNILEASAGISHRPGSRGTWTLDGGYQQAWTSGRIANDYTYLNGQVGYAQQVSDRTSVTARVGVGYSDFADRSAGDGTIITPSIGVTTQLSPRLSLSVQGGVSFSRIKQGNGTSRSATQLSGSAQLCNGGERQSYCVAASRATQPTLDGSVRAITSVSADYQRRLNRRDELSASVSYSRTDASLLNSIDDRPQFLSTSVTYSRQFYERLQGFVSGGFDKVLGSPVDRDTNFRIRVGARYVLGRVR